MLLKCRESNLGAIEMSIQRNTFCCSAEKGHFEFELKCSFREQLEEKQL